MAGPITWRNVAGPSPAEALNPLIASQQSIDGAFGAFQRVLASREAFNASQAANLRESNKQAFLEALAGAKTPEALAALESTGQLSSLKSRLTPDGLSAVRGADEARAAGLRQQLVANQQFDDSQTERAQLPVKDQYGALLAQGKIDEANALLVANPQLRGQALLRDAGAKAQRTQVQQARDDLNFGLDYVSKVRSGEIGQINLDAAKVAAKDNEANRNFETTLANERLRVSAEREATGGRLGALAKEMGLKVTAQGYPDFNAWDSQQLVSFDDVAELKGLPTSKIYGSGDTQKADALNLRLLAQFPRQAQANEAAIRSVYSGAQGTPVGNDAVNVAFANAANQVGFDRQDANNAFHAPGSADARNTFDALAKEIPEIIKGMPSDWTRGINASEDIPDLQKSLMKIATEGVKVNIDGKEQMVVPSASVVKGLLRTVEGGWFSDSKRAQNLETAIKDWMNSSAGQTMIKQGLESQQYQDKQKVLQIFRESLNPSKK